VGVTVNVARSEDEAGIQAKTGKAVVNLDLEQEQEQEPKPKPKAEAEPKAEPEKE
jgi:hypothetical protein